MAATELTTLARPYARAVFDLACAKKTGLARWAEVLAALSTAAEDTKMRALLGDPVRTHDEQAELLLSVLGEDLPENPANLVRVLAANGRLPLLPQIGELFAEMKAEHEKVVWVEVITAYDLTDTEKDALTSDLTRRLAREVRLSSRTDKHLLGGVIVRTNDEVLDYSLRGRLSRLAQAMSA